ncbi:hypothetical protein [Gilliamella sp. Pas-s25]|uniref:hypothetical protein n=1 Tax=Gilliamella sp. Pas-s25 TaxID=2687310 RepID=UPI00135E0C2D|nr:hypothetical protein [Gilliamella sp. Pas-s25]MWP62007.1 hypothetical protein [Gilliamella sp. Pas-s25]
MGLIISYTDDAFNRRTSKTVDGKTTEFFIRLIHDTNNQDYTIIATVITPALYQPRPNRTRRR